MGIHLDAEALHDRHPEIAPAAARDEDFRARFSRSVDGEDRERLAKFTASPPGPCGSKQAGGSGTDDQDVAGPVNGSSNRERRSPSPRSSLKAVLVTTS